MTDTTRAPSAYPMTRSCPFDVPAEYRHLRDEDPISQVVLPDGSTAWLITRYEDVRAILGDSRVSSDRTHPGFPSFGGVVGIFPGAFIFMDPPEHDVLRRMLAREFMVKQVESMRPRIEAIVDGLLDAMLTMPAPVDLVDAFAMPLPSLVICELLGVPYEDHELFQGHTRVIVTRASTPDDVRQAHMALRQYLADLVVRKEQEPGDDLISRLIAEQVRPGHLTHAELAGMATVLLAAGHETTGNMTALGLLALLQNREQFDRLCADPSLVPNAVEELLRYLSIIDSAQRVAAQDIEIGGRTIRAGEGIIAALSSADWDDEVFPDPSTLDVGRHARNHVAFGQGIHQCLGAPLARVELQVAYASVVRRMPTLRLAVPLEEVAFKHDTAAYGVHSLPVAW